MDGELSLILSPQPPLLLTPFHTSETAPQAARPTAEDDSQQLQHAPPNRGCVFRERGCQKTKWRKYKRLVDRSKLVPAG